MTWVWIISLGLVGLFLSAFFSGSETGFYRATRLRLVLDAMGGDYVSRGLLWLTNHPSIFVATTLVGNNLANYLTSLAIVIGAQAVVNAPGHAAELLAPLALAPLLFVYGELLPKSLFLRAPNRLLRRGAPLFLFFTLLFLPVSAMLWTLNKLLARLVGQSFEEARLGLARRELRRMVDEGHQAGILYPSQRHLAQGIFGLAGKPVTRFITPLRQMPRARADMSREDVLRLAGRHRVSIVPVESPDGPGTLAGYVRVIEVALSGSEALEPLHPLVEIPASATHLDALMRLQTARESLARVVGPSGETIGVVSIDRLREPLLPSRTPARIIHECS
jgi:putative hemolysin